MKRMTFSNGVTGRGWRSAIAIACAVLLVPGEGILLAQSATPPAAPAAAAEADDPPLTADQLDSLVAPIALYPDDLLAMVLASSTYPLELMQLQQWMAKHKDLKDKALADAVAKQPWDPSVQSMAAVPEALKRLTDDIQWTTDLGNAFLDQQKDVMDACQRMRKKAKDKGALTSNEQMKVETKVVETKEIIYVQSSNPEVIYVPSYNPTYVYPPPVYPYPPVYYPPYTAGAAFFTFTAGVMIGAAFWGGSCCGCGWGGGSNVNVERQQQLQPEHEHQQREPRPGRRRQQLDAQPAHRGGTPYGNKASASKYGGQTRGQQNSRAGGSPSASNRASGGAGGNRGGASAGTSDRSGSGNRGGSSPSASNRSSGGGSRGGSDSIGGRNMSSGASSKGGGSFGGGSGGYSGKSAAASSSRGSSSMSSRGGGGGGSRGGGGGGRGGRR